MAKLRLSKIIYMEDKIWFCIESAFIFVSLFLVVGTFLQFKVSKSEKGSG